MKNKDYILGIAASAAIGTAVGIISKPNKPLLGGVLGAGIGAIAGSIIATMHKNGEVDAEYYSSSVSQLYENQEDVAII